MSMLDVWTPPSTEELSTQELSILPDPSVPNKPPGLVRSAMNTLDYLGTVAGLAVGFIAGVANEVHGFIDSRL
ncbi:MAG: hypothetical protein QG623_212 [Patescibacteria group bacterium]|nr:hypothetical protein [Patescibacteria group bacterium]